MGIKRFLNGGTQYHIFNCPECGQVNINIDWCQACGFVENMDDDDEKEDSEDRD